MHVILAMADNHTSCWYILAGLRSSLPRVHFVLLSKLTDVSDWHPESALITSDYSACMHMPSAPVCACANHVASRMLVREKVMQAAHAGSLLHPCSCIPPSHAPWQWLSICHALVSHLAGNAAWGLGVLQIFLPIRMPASRTAHHACESFGMLPACAGPVCQRALVLHRDVCPGPFQCRACLHASADRDLPQAGQVPARAAERCPACPHHLQQHLQHCCAAGTLQQKPMLQLMRMRSLAAGRLAVPS